MRAFEISKLSDDLEALGDRWLEFLRVESLSAGIYRLPAGGTDEQEPHRQDEVYHVVEGRAVLRVEDRDVPVGPGSIVFVPALAEHRFHSIEDDVTALVLFAPPEA